MGTGPQRCISAVVRLLPRAWHDGAGGGRFRQGVSLVDSLTLTKPCTWRGGGGVYHGTYVPSTGAVANRNKSGMVLLGSWKCAPFLIVQ